MNKLHIAVDFDEVLRPFLDPLQERYNRLKGTSHAVEEHADYDFQDVWGVSVEEVIEEIDDYCASPEHIEARPLPFVQGSTYRLREQGHDLTIVTARPEEVAEFTDDWLTRYMPGVFSEVIYCSHEARDGESRSKESVLLEHDMDVLIDDSPGHVKNAQNHDLEAILFGDYPWNMLPRHRNGVVRAATDWLEVELHIEQIARNGERI